MEMCKIVKASCHSEQGYRFFGAQKILTEGFPTLVLCSSFTPGFVEVSDFGFDVIFN